MLKLKCKMAWAPCIVLLLTSCLPAQLAAKTSKTSPYINYSFLYSNIAPANASSFYTAKYKEWKLQEAGISTNVFNYAVTGFEYLRQHNALSNTKIITIVDFSKPSTSERLFTIDLETGEILFKTLVAHGKNTGQQYATNFSNQESSYESSLGFYITMDTYTGNNGYSLRLKGCEKGFNDKAQQRNIVVHGADYVSENFIRQNGFLGRSHGCPAVPVEESNAIINTIRNGTCLFIYQPNKKYLRQSHFINRQATKVQK